MEAQMGSGELNGFSAGSTEPSQPGNTSPALPPLEIADNSNAWENAWIDLGGEG
jgi:hypothetical protein